MLGISFSTNSELAKTLTLSRYNIQSNTELLFFKRKVTKEQEGLRFKVCSLKARKLSYRDFKKFKKGGCGWN